MHALTLSGVVGHLKPIYMHYTINKGMYAFPLSAEKKTIVCVNIYFDIYGYWRIANRGLVKLR